GAGGRYLVDQKGVPFFIHGDSPWSLLVQLAKADAGRYLEDRSRKGYNAIILELIEHQYAENPPRNRAGDGPFTRPGDFSTPNEAYFAHVDWVLRKAAGEGILVLLAPCWAGAGGGGEGWSAELKANGAARCRNYGRYLGNRCRNHRN